MKKYYIKTGRVRGDEYEVIEYVAVDGPTWDRLSRGESEILITDTGAVLVKKIKIIYTTI